MDYYLSVLALQTIGRAGQNEPVYAGTLVFGVIGLILTYLSFFHDEMDAGRIMKIMSIALLALAVLAAFWPLRPWPH